MSTPSTIALEFENGRVGFVYCHWDGHLNKNGRILQKHYQDPAKVAELIALGDLSSLGVNIGEKHDFEAVTEDCTFYGRDRGETDVAALFYKSFDDYLMDFRSQDYNYILRRDGKWYWAEDADFQPLDEAIESMRDPLVLRAIELGTNNE
jgi:hypothetical protein